MAAVETPERKYCVRASLAWFCLRDYNGLMIKTLGESKAKLSELVELASQDVLISVRGKVKARLTRAALSGTNVGRATWIRKLRGLQSAYSIGKSKTSVDDILAQLRQDRS